MQTDDIITKEKYREMYHFSERQCKGLRAMAENIISADKKIVIDVAATGNNTKTDEIYRLSVIDISGYILYDSFFVPESYHSKFQVKDLSIIENAPTLREQIFKIDEILLSANTIIGFELGKVMAFLRQSGCIWRTNYDFISIQTAFEDHCDAKKAALNDCAAYFGYELQDVKPYDTVEKCNAILHCYNKIIVEGWDIDIE